MKHWFVVVVLGSLVVAGCSGSDGDSAVSSPTAGRSEDKVRCEASGALDEAYEALSTPGVFDLSEESIEEVFAQRRAAIRTLADVAQSDAEADALDELDDNYRVVEPAYVEALTEKPLGHQRTLADSQPDPPDLVSSGRRRTESAAEKLAMTIGVARQHA